MSGSVRSSGRPIPSRSEMEMEMARGAGVVVRRHPCTGETYKDYGKLFNAGLDGNTWRAIDIPLKPTVDRMHQRHGAGLKTTTKAKAAGDVCALATASSHRAASDARAWPQGVSF